MKKVDEPLGNCVKRVKECPFLVCVDLCGVVSCDLQLQLPSQTTRTASQKGHHTSSFVFENTGFGRGFPTKRRFHLSPVAVRNLFMIIFRWIS